MEEETDEVTGFAEILSLKKYRINHAYAACNYSLFQTADGKILVCGNNSYGELLLPNPTKEFVFGPRESGIKDATFCIAGNYATAVFIGCDPLKSPNRLKSSSETMIYKPSYSSPDMSVWEEENKRLREENESLRKMIEDKNVLKLQIEIKKLKELNDEQENKIKELQNEKI